MRQQRVLKAVSGLANPGQLARQVRVRVRVRDKARVRVGDHPYPNPNPNPDPNPDTNASDRAPCAVAAHRWDPSSGLLGWP